MIQWTLSDYIWYSFSVKDVWANNTVGLDRDGGRSRGYEKNWSDGPHVWPAFMHPTRSEDNRAAGPTRTTHPARVHPPGRDDRQRAPENTPTLPSPPRHHDACGNPRFESDADTCAWCGRLHPSATAGHPRVEKFTCHHLDIVIHVTIYPDTHT